MLPENVGKPFPQGGIRKTHAGDQAAFRADIGLILHGLAVRTAVPVSCLIRRVRISDAIVCFSFFALKKTAQLYIKGHAVLKVVPYVFPENGPELPGAQRELPGILLPAAQILGSAHAK